MVVDDFFAILSFEKILMLESHVEHRIQTHTYDVMKKKLVPYIQTLLGAVEYPELLILTVAGILDTNCFEILLMSQNMELGGLFLISLILCHDCIPNTRHYVNYVNNNIESQRFQMTFETTGKLWFFLVILNLNFLLCFVVFFSSC